VTRRTRVLLAFAALLGGIALGVSVLVNLYESPAGFARLGGATLLSLTLLYVAWILVAHQDPRPPEPPNGGRGSP